MGDVDRGLNLARVRTLGLTAGPRSLHPDQSENLSGVLIRVARSKIPSLSPSFRIIRASGPRPRLRSVRFAWHKQSEILKHCRTKCDNSAWPSTPLDRMYPTRAAHAGGIAGLGIFSLGIFRRRVQKSLDRKNIPRSVIRFTLASLRDPLAPIVRITSILLLIYSTPSYLFGSSSFDRFRSRRSIFRWCLGDADRTPSLPDDGELPVSDGRATYREMSNWYIRAVNRAYAWHFVARRGRRKISSRATRPSRHLEIGAWFVDWSSETVNNPICVYYIIQSLRRVRRGEVRTYLSSCHSQLIHSPRRTTFLCCTFIFFLHNSYSKNHTKTFISLILSIKGE